MSRPLRIALWVAVLLLPGGLLLLPFGLAEARRHMPARWRSRRFAWLQRLIPRRWASRV